MLPCLTSANGYALFNLYVSAVLIQDDRNIKVHVMKYSICLIGLSQIRNYILAECTFMHVI